jgi:magnesium transporter
VGVVSLKQLLLQEGSLPLSRLATFDVKTILENYDLDLVANLFRKYDNLLAVPVISPDDTMRGIITLDDALYVIDAQASEDIFLSSGINPEVADERNLLTGPMINAVKARMPWLTITLLGQFVASTIIASHSKTVAAATIAISFMPMLTGLSGNIGAQSETITVRGLALSLISRESLFRQYLREVRVGLTIGSVFGVSVGIISFIIYKHWALSALLACWMIISMSLSVSMGILLPSIYKFFVKQDPAGVTGPFITTLSDILTFSIYLYVISLFIEYMI